MVFRHRFKGSSTQGGVASISRPNSGSRRIIAFNSGNDLYVPPDSRKVSHLRHSFPGTLTSLRFYLDRENLLELVGKAA